MSEQQTNPRRRSRLVNGLGYLAITLALTLPLAVLTVRTGAWQQGLLLYALSCAGAALVLAIFIMMAVLPRYRSWRSPICKRALFTLPGTLLLVSILASRGDYPPIHDITTDLANPPVFNAAAQRRGEGSNTLDIVPETLTAQRNSYPDLQTLHSKLPIEKVFQKAKDTALAMGWNIYHEDLNQGVIEAADTTAIMGFTDDIVIRLRTNTTGTLIDLRSVSRVGVGDLGANANRIRKFHEVFNQ